MNRSYRPLLWSTGGALLLVVGGLALLGIPGALFALLAEPVVAIATGADAGELLAGDRAWPMRSS